ncbi:baseplate protein [Microcystis phage vB_MweS-yong2]|nr:baseplate protein [Microcystis phage vB_MweS-yong2]
MTVCLTAEQWRQALAALRPRGDAWRNGSHDAIDGSTMGQFLAGAAESYADVDARLCALVDEYFCSTAVETRDLWALEHGLPDGCDPFADACEKANAVGDTTPAYVVAAASRRGWAIAIREEWLLASQDARCGLALAGAASCACEMGVMWEIVVSLSGSPAYVDDQGKPSLAGLMLAGDVLNCPPNIEPLRCLVRRIAPAHADLVFLTTP